MDSGIGYYDSPVNRKTQSVASPSLLLFHSLFPGKFVDFVLFGPTKHLHNWLCLSVGWLVGRSVGRVTHSFDDQHVAPYWPTWPCSLRLALSVNAGNSPNRRDCHCRYSLFCGHSSSLGKLFLQFHWVVLNPIWVSNALLWLHYDTIAHHLIHGWGTETFGLKFSASYFTGLLNSYLLPLLHKETRSP